MGVNKMRICPIMSLYLSKEEAHYEHFTQCWVEDCAWWDEKSKKCAIVAIASISRVIGNTTI